MEQRKEFAVVAGPNGAGKSTVSQFYTKALAFDGDLMGLNLGKEHPDWPDRWISGTVAGALEKAKFSAIENNMNFAFETNFSNNMILEMINEFKSANYKICLYYFGIDSLGDSLLRVLRRFQMGGHLVADETIKYNFYEGTKNVLDNLHLFDYITFIDSILPYGKVIANYRKRESFMQVVDNPPKWFLEFEKRLNSLISSS